MEPESFTSNKRGRVIKSIDGYWAFHPNPLPRKIAWSHEVVAALDNATAAVNRLGGVGRLLPNPHLLIAPHLRLEAVLSSRIEGTKTNVEDLLRFEAGEESATEQDDTQEVANYITAMEHGVQRTRDGFPISIRLFREVHERLLKDVRGKFQNPGELRKSPVWIGGSNLTNAIFVPPPTEAMHTCLYDLEKFLHEKSLPILIQLAMGHYQFEAIHPFLDGNGRVGRLLIPFLLVDRQVLSQPLLYLSAYFERYRSDYYDHLLRISQTGDFDAWFTFFLTGVSKQAKDSEDRTVRLVDLQIELRDTLLQENRSSSVIQLAELLFASPVVTVRMVEKMLNVSNPTARRVVETLLERGTLEEASNRKRNRIFRAPQIYEAVYGDVT